jgi:hypothetical protein
VTSATEGMIKHQTNTGMQMTIKKQCFSLSSNHHIPASSHRVPYSHHHSHHRNHHFVVFSTHHGVVGVLSFFWLFAIHLLMLEAIPIIMTFFFRDRWSRHALMVW